MDKAKRYYTFCFYDPTAEMWYDDFGSYDHGEVAVEMREYDAPARHKRIIYTDGSLEDLLRVKAALPHPKH